MYFKQKTLGVFGVMLCLLGTAHHVFIPVNEELTPHLLPDGGGFNRRTCSFAFA